MFSIILMVFAFVFLAVAACNINPPRVSLGWLGMAFWALSIIFSGIGSHVGFH